MVNAWKQLHFHATARLGRKQAAHSQARLVH
jgi:hypothetical protein